ncbi:hypothetical protein D554_3767 [Bordetella holmesii 30539]|uniref:N-acetyltransferase YedL n=1 Tax=Bordetella holmesii 1058 TaxID=1247648 RepID=A0ABP3BGZ7_9BORD|nr:hypothetical protein D560_3888 [Bordetella holmesii ATCC 51541]AIT28499.1 hypothetical protein D558_3859 [Bordetella holmesii 44057]EWM42152.1 hypothetical protein D556_3861 [Bordetella holmesii 41130]EXF88490.1 hypothetical protein D554_3767 [Bordetella holmesii 30539]EXX94492.1 hypothetical protein D559_1901 [Bordetella holmesii 1058]
MSDRGVMVSLRVDEDQSGPGAARGVREMSAARMAQSQ